LWVSPAKNPRTAAGRIPFVEQHSDVTRGRGGRPPPGAGQKGGSKWGYW